MKRKVLSAMMVCIIMINCFTVFSPILNVYAFKNFNVEVTRNNAPIRDGYYETKAELKLCPKGVVITIVGEKRNLWGNLWYKVQGGGYIFSDNVKKTNKKHAHIYKLTHYENAHPHSANYECVCGYGYCGTETKKVKGCEKCYPTSTESKKDNTNKIPNTNLNTKADILVPSRPSLQEEAEKNLGTPVHEHNYKFSHYESSHPHYAVYKCSCPESYKDTGKTQKQSGCEQCNTHYHSYKLIGYSDSHPHYATYQCSCKSAYTGTETTNVKECKQCYPYGYGNDHACQFVCTSQFLNEHPHYTITQCSVCGKQDIDRKETNYSKDCNICNSDFNDKLDKLPDFYGRVYDLSTGGIIYTPKKVTLEELYSFAEQAHLTLDALGLIPGVGEVFDGINVLYYIVEGNYVDAALSGAAMVPFVGVVSTSGKIVKNAGKIVTEASTGTVKVISKKVTNGTVEVVSKKVTNGAAEVVSKKVTKEVAEELTKEIVAQNLKNISKPAKNIILNSNNIPKVTLKAIKDISENKSIKYADVFYKGELLIDRNYMGSIKSSTGLKYVYNTIQKEQKNTMYHILDKHAYNKSKNKVVGVNYFNVDGKEIFDLIEDVYENSSAIKTKVVTDNGRITRTSHIINAGRVIGTEGEDKLLLILEGDNVISAYPTLDSDFKK